MNFFETGRPGRQHVVRKPFLIWHPTRHLTLILWIIAHLIYFRYGDLRLSFDITTLPKTHRVWVYSTVPRSCVLQFQMNFEIPEPEWQRTPEDPRRAWDSDSPHYLGPVSSGQQESRIRSRVKYTFKSQVVEAIRISYELAGNATDHAELCATYAPVTRA